MHKIAVVTNIPSPYMVDLYYYMYTHIMEYKFFIIYTNSSELNRKWHPDKEKMVNSYILKSRIIKRKQTLDTEYIHLPTGIMHRLSSINPEAVIAFEYNPAALQSLMWCRLHRKKFIHITDGTLNSERHIGRIQKWSRRIIIGNADAFIASSTKAKEKLLAWKVPEGKIFVSLLTVDITLYLSLQRNTEPGRILYVGSMVKRKGLDLLIQALPYIDIEYKLHVVGNGTDEERDSLKKLAEQNYVADRIIWVGYKQGKELLEEYSRAAAFVLPTREDCFGLVLIEAACAGVPVVASKYADGAYDVVRNGKNGYIVDPYDSKALAKALAKALKKKDMPTALREKEYSAFLFSNVVKGYMEAIRFAL